MGGFKKNLPYINYKYINMADIRQSQLLEFGDVTEYTLTSSYVASDAVRVMGVYQVGLDVGYTMGATETGNSVQLLVSFSNAEVPTSADWYQAVSESTSSGVTTIALQNYTFAAVSAAATFDNFHLGFPVDAIWVRVSAKETGVATNAGTLRIAAALSERGD